jgi:nucleotide-binding universal stress UspA family protein
MHLLLYNDDSEMGLQALDLGRRLALSLASEVDILAIPRKAGGKEAVNKAIEKVARRLRTAGVKVTVLQRPGLMAEQVIRQACSTPYDLVVIGSEGRQGLKRWLVGSRACNVIGKTVTSILVVKGRRRKVVDNLLVCSAVGPTSDETVRFAGQVARALDASVELLHVMSQVALEEHAHAPDLEAEAEDLIENETREGDHLERMLDLLRSEGVEARAYVRHGAVVDEIMAEAQEGRFDILVIGAHTTPGIRSLLVDDLSEKIMLAANRPVLVVQQSEEDLECDL